jgi:hypothetical protein
MSSFLNSAELQKDAVKIEVVRDRLMEGDELISVQKGEFSWTAGQSEPTLHDINLSLKVSVAACRLFSLIVRFSAILNRFGLSMSATNKERTIDCGRWSSRKWQEFAPFGLVG